ncbi:hypothetical protein BKI52_05075 [marine bacterium AO1-C]|nr:hypothetical protein BKI52_05075 [marine bacterium AO1-C]
MMKRNIFLVVIGLLLLFKANNLAAQKYKPGYILTKDGKKMTGFIKISTVSASALNCNFAYSETGEGKTVYIPKDLNGYGYIGEQAYESKLVTFYDIVEQTEVKKRLFLEVLAKGEVNLYYFKDNQPSSKRQVWQSANHYYIQKGDREIVELTIKGRIVLKNSKKYASTTKLYIGTLNYTLTGCASIKKMLNNTRLSRKSLKKIINKYNYCINPSSQQLIIEKRQRYNWLGFSMQFFNSNLSFSGVPARTVSGGKASGVSFGTFLMIGLDRNQRVFGETGVNFFRRNYQLNNTSNASREYDYDISVMQIPVMVTFATPNPKLQAFAGLGVGFNFALGISETLSERPSPAVDLNEDFNKSGVSFLLSAGVRGVFNNSMFWKFEGRWENNQEFLNDSGQGSTAKILTFGFGVGVKL